MLSVDANTAHRVRVVAERGELCIPLLPRMRQLLIAEIFLFLI